MKVKCIPCAGKGYRWGRGRMGEGYMVKHGCTPCKGTGKVEQREEKKS